MEMKICVGRSRQALTSVFFYEKPRRESIAALHLESGS